MLAKDIFKTIVKATPLFAIDLVIINEHDELLLGRRLNPPAKDYWFVPGGRVFKDESLVSAFQRISDNELGAQFELSQAILLGMFDHFYDESIFGNNISTHYINAPHFLRVNSGALNLPIGDQHINYRWLNLSEVEFDSSIHYYSKVFMPSLLSTMTSNHCSLSSPRA